MKPRMNKRRFADQLESSIELRMFIRAFTTSR